jgi:serine/threonine-protein kinase
MEIDVGRVVAGKYELSRLLGRGSMGEVWAAQHRTLGEQLAVKLLTLTPSSEEELEDSRTAAARFLFEAQVAARLSRKTRHIVRVTDHGEEEGRAYLVMELLEGETLEAVLARDGRVAPDILVKIVTQVSRALAQAHEEGVLHRDLKPANVFLTKDEDGKLLVKLLDFGIARVIHAHRAPSTFSTAKGLVFGTPSYMSPEQARASAKLDHQCDLWALSTIAYEALSGELPVDGKDTDELLKNLCAGRIVPLRQRAPAMTVEVEIFFGRAFSDTVSLRYSSAAELAQAFARAVSSTGSRRASTDPPAGPASETPAALSSSVTRLAGEHASRIRGEARRRLIAFGIVAALVGAVGIGVVWRAMAPTAIPLDPARAGPAKAASLLPPVGPPGLAATGSASAAGANPGSSAPTIAFSSLPKVGTPPARPGLAPTIGTPVLTPSPPSTAVAPPPEATPAPTPVPSAPPTSTAKRVDKSEVL